LLDLVAAVAERLIEAPERPQFVRVAEPHPPQAGGGGGYGAYFGSVPDFGQTSGGVKFADVRDGSPAARAGFRAGDVLVEFDGKPIDNLYDFTYALRSRKPGDEVVVKVRRGDEVITARVRLEQRR
jgi:S1-C subfamily serine protease